MRPAATNVTPSLRYLAMKRVHNHALFTSFLWRKS